MEAEDLIQQALTLAPGEKLQVVFSTPSEVNSMRVNLSRRKAALSKVSPTVAERLSIQINTRNKTVTLKMTDEPPRVFKITADGTRTQVVHDPELDRIAELMREDGRSEEEINEFREMFNSGESE